MEKAFQVKGSSYTNPLNTCTWYGIYQCAYISPYVFLPIAIIIVFEVTEPVNHVLLREHVLVKVE